ncbi:hypothetical protein I3F58_08485 [Streptomyces sp. MUM 203J]|uniref:hypothetical protein n=1 Tax=Streptomyces sp. MUM 203J TaxID=2791990 RepID=UPI001F036004|nr:hypothetical protein [Streptomyces sp. MUM 203J]MCH0539604.1 hypothetical protein [Streptomyces sp. MUM 203J]
MVAVCAGAVALAALPCGAASADEDNRQSHNGPRVGLINAGQIDDPMEDVLEHVAVLGRNLIAD